MGYLTDSNTVLFSLDEMGIGSEPLRHYGYAKVCKPAILYRKKAMIAKNLTCTTTISKNGLEFIQFFYGGGFSYPIIVIIF